MKPSTVNGRGRCITMTQWQSCGGGGGGSHVGGGAVMWGGGGGGQSCGGGGGVVSQTEKWWHGYHYEDVKNLSILLETIYRVPIYDFELPVMDTHTSLLSE